MKVYGFTVRVYNDDDGWHDSAAKKSFRLFSEKAKRDFAVDDYDRMHDGIDYDLDVFEQEVE